MALRCARLYSGFNEYRSGVASFAVSIGGALIFVSISGRTQFDQLAIGTVMSSITLALALAQFELCWQIGLRVTAHFYSEQKK